MSKVCPINNQKVLYLDCIECDKKICKKSKNKIVIGIDQSYKRTGISIGVNGELSLIKSLDLSIYKTNTEKRNKLKAILLKIINNINNNFNNIEYSSIICIIERIRLRSKGFLNIDYIKSIGALNALIIDTMYDFSIPVYSVDTRCWKAQVIGTSKGEVNSYNVPEEKWPTIKWLCNKGFKKNILINMDDSKKTKNTFIKNGHKYMFDNDAADSAGICMFGFIGDFDKLLLEK